ncbi:hypothetical protein MXB_3702 [Myxobolus squamalis]|nr:hypothetical protein MXB_3702 [Myxobolus squamalis]
MISRILKPALALGMCAGIYLQLEKNVYMKKKPAPISIGSYEFPTRENLIHRLKNEEFDVLVIGGGATGAGTVYEASARGLKAALVERNDFSSGTSSKSTKLIHGGVRYLQKAILNLDYEEFKLVKESLAERKLMLKDCPNMVTPIPILLPCSSLFDFVFKAIGLTLYQLISLDFSMFPKYASKRKIESLFPFINSDIIFNGIIYSDGQFDDARMNLSVIKSAISMGAAACNYVVVESLLDDGDKFNGVVLRDKISGEIFTCRTKSIVNATGAYTDSIRKMVDPSRIEICKPSLGTHLSMPKNLTQHGVGLLINEPNNRVLFVLPWEGTTLLGTSDEETQIKEKPTPSKTEVSSLLARFSKIVKDESIADQKYVKSCWSGMRPLVVEPNSDSPHSSNLSRTHLIEVKKNMVSVCGGKWTIFRKMGEDTIDSIEKIIGTEKQNCDRHIHPYGSAGWTPEMTKMISSKHKIDLDVAEHLSRGYGLAAENIAKSSQKPLTRIHRDFPYTEEEITYICHNEYICTLEDIVARRLRLAFIDAQATEEVLDHVARLAGTSLGWSDEKIRVLIK